MSIKFGTDGWRAVIADEYTFENLRRVSKAAAIAFQDHPKINKGIIIGYDTRFLSREFAECSAIVFANHGIKVLLTDSYVTTPTVSLITKDKQLAFGVMITSSHNPAKYNGFKMKDEFGGSMGTGLLNGVEKILDENPVLEYGNKQFESLLIERLIELIDGKRYYIENLKSKIDVSSIENSDIKILYDAMFGSGQGMMECLVPIKALRSEINPSFGGSSPEPVEKNLDLIRTSLERGEFDIGIVTDGDADRIAILDEKGRFVDAQKTFALLLTYLLDQKKMSGGVARGFSSSELISKICEVNKLKLFTVPIGFKYISELMVKEDILIGAEESGGIGIKGHLPERDGIFNGLLFSEMLASRKMKLSALVSEIESKYGKFYYKRVDKHLNSNDEKVGLLAKAQTFTEIAGFPVIRKDNLDGCKLIFENGWLLVRASGTEPLLRLYTETYESDSTLKILNDIVMKLGI